uniref:Uncharacterized protein n=1 Tax=Ailuropoda melanoleuca TaxID=9646 RepID=A0A7N5JYQ1_AILME
MLSGAANPRGAGARSLAEGAGKGRRRATNRHWRGEGEKKGWRRGNARRERPTLDFSSGLDPRGVFQTHVELYAGCGAYLKKVKSKINK